MADTDAAAPVSPRAEAPGAAQPEEGLRYADADFLRLVDDECRRSVGFGEGDTGELARVRIKAQEYRQGKIVDLAVIKGRSAAVDTTLGESLDTVMPDIMEVFFGGDDVVSFQAQGAQDEARAREETDAVVQVVMHQNEAFRAFHDAIQDALLNRTGIFHWWWEDEEAQLGAMQADGPEQAAALQSLAAMQRPWAKAEVQTRDDGTIAVALSERRGRVCFKAVPSEDFTVSADTISLRSTPYCALRDRVRVQDLIARGVDKAVARGLPIAGASQDEMQQARDEAGEDDRANAGGIDDLRIVEVRTHYLRVDADDDGDVEIWRVETDAEQTVLLSREAVTQVPFGALTPYLSAHRFYGESLADKLFEVMRIKTVLLRMLLDSGYFALNQRMEVSEEQASEFTIADLLNNAPNVPVRSKSGQAVRPLQAGALSFDVMGAMEFMATVAEQRSGVVRNAQGLNPDTLHDTATGAQQLMAAAQKRVRFICRILAETGVKDLFLGVHQMMRENAGPDYAPTQMKVGRNWRDVHPGEWAERSAVTIHVGVGSSDKDQERAAQTAALGVVQQVVQLQGGVGGPFVTAQNLYNRLMAFSRANGEKDPDQYWSDPSQSPPGQQQGGHVDPAVLQAQNQMQLEREKLAAQTQTDQQRAQNDMAIARAKLASDAQLQRERQAGDLALQRQRAAQDLELQQQEMHATLALKAQAQQLNASRSTDVGGSVEDLPG